MPKTGYSAQDSIGRYQPSYPVIDASPPKIQRVAHVESKSGDLPHARDRLESKQKRLERLLIEQFIKLKFAPPGKEEEMAALLAKYLYLGILVPVDFLFFEMPEKMLKKLLMQMKKSKKLFDRLIHLRPILQHQVQKLVEKIVHLSKKVQEGLGAVIKRPQQFVQKQVEKVVHTYTQVVETLKEVIQTVM
ncbi:MAG: hypothetical protein KDK65_04350, partial [Chlamydiia bacterium]|nr:hypothetical protein [Chlamydiia bacterium]